MTGMPIAGVFKVANDYAEIYYLLQMFAFFDRQLTD